MGYIAELWNRFMFLQAIQFKILKFPWKNAKNHEKIRKLLAPSIFEIKTNVPDVCHTIFWFYRKIIIAQESSHKKNFSRRSVYEILWQSQLGGTTREPPNCSKITITPRQNRLNPNIWELIFPNFVFFTLTKLCIVTSRNLYWVFLETYTFKLWYKKYYWDYHDMRPTGTL